jgi:hypothetical protein
MSDIGNLPVEPVPEGQVRVGDAERHEAAGALGEHFATGRLDQQEFDDRVQAAYAARTRVDLQRLFVDLPEPAPFRAGKVQPAGRPAPSPAPPAWRPPVFVAVFPLLAVVLIVASIVVGHVPVFPFFFLFWMWFGWGRRAWRGPRRYAGTRSW